MKNTLDAIRYGLETLDVTPKELFSLIESSNRYDGDDYKRWLANEIIKIAEKDEVGYSQLLAKWFNLIYSIIEEYSNASIKESYKRKLFEYNGTNVYTLGISDEEYGIELTDIDWGTKVDLPYNYDFINTLPEGLRDDLTNNKGVTLFVKFNPKESFKKNSDIVLDGKINGVSIKNFDAMIMYRVCSLVRALDDMGTNFKFVFITDTKFLYDVENSDVIKYFLSYFKYNGFVVNSKDLYEGSYTSEEYAICECILRGIDDEIQDGFVLHKTINSGNDFTISSVCKRYSQGSNMLEALLNKYNSTNYDVNVPMLDRDNKVVGVCKGLKNAYGYLCKGISDRSAVLTCYPLKDTKYIAITKENLYSVISYYGVTRSMDNSGMFLDILEIIDGHPDYKNLVSNCVPIFLFDINSRFCDIGVVKNKIGKDIKLVNKFDIFSSELVKKLIDSSSIYFSYEAKELMSSCMELLKLYKKEFGDSFEGLTFEGIRKDLNNAEVNKNYLNALSRCKDYISSIYKQMY